jgi:hypothetical protein
MAANPTIEQRRAAVATASSLLAGLGEAVVAVGNTDLGPFFKTSMTCRARWKRRGSRSCGSRGTWWLRPTAFQVAIDSGDADHAPKAGSTWGCCVRGRGDLVAAATAFQVAIDSGHADHAPAAAYILERLRQEG